MDAQAMQLYSLDESQNIWKWQKTGLKPPNVYQVQNEKKKVISMKLIQLQATGDLYRWIGAKTVI